MIRERARVLASEVVRDIRRILTPRRRHWAYLVFGVFVIMNWRWSGGRVKTA